MRELNPECPNFLDESDNRFRRLQGTLDSYFHKLHSQGIGRQVKHAETISAKLMKKPAVGKWCFEY